MWISSPNLYDYQETRMKRTLKHCHVVAKIVVKIVKSQKINFKYTGKGIAQTFKHKLDKFCHRLKSICNLPRMGHINKYVQWMP